MASVCVRFAAAIVLLFLVNKAMCEDANQSLCVDKLPNCDDYVNTTCTTYPSWGKTNCALTCDMCEGSCPQGWSLYEAEGTCLQGIGFNNHHTMPWNLARNNCKKLGGDLVIIRDLEKHTFVSDTFGNHGINYWIGIQNVGQEYFDFQYVDGTKVTYQPWLPGNPKHKGGLVENCVCVYPVNEASKLGGWENYECEIYVPYVCEKTSITSAAA